MYFFIHLKFKTLGWNYSFSLILLHFFSSTIVANYLLLVLLFHPSDTIGVPHFIRIRVLVFLILLRDASNLIPVLAVFFHNDFLSFRYTHFHMNYFLFPALFDYIHDVKLIIILFLFELKFQFKKSLDFLVFHIFWVP